MSLLNKAFVGMDVIDGVGKVKNTFDASSSNKYDKIMGTKPIKTTYNGGQINAINGKNNQRKRQLLASEELGEMYKTASKKTPKNNKVKARVTDNEMYKKLRDLYKNNEAKMGVNFSDASNKFKDGKIILKKTLNGVGTNKRKITDKRIVNGLKVGLGESAKGLVPLGKGVLRATPALAGMAGAGYGTYKIMDKLEKSKNEKDRNDLYPKAMGTMIAGTLLLNGAIKKNPYSTYNVVGKSLGKTVSKIPSDIIRATGPVGKTLVKVTKDVKKETGSILKKMEDASKKGTKHFKKKASEELDDFFFEKSAKQYNLKSFAKDVLKENVLKGGVESLFYFGVPSAISYGLKRDFKKGGIKIKEHKINPNLSTTVIEVPLEKKAKTVDISPNMEKFIRRSADGVGRVFIPGITSAVIGRNIMDNMKNLDEYDENNELIKKELEPGKARVIIQTNNNLNNMNLNKKANDSEEEKEDENSDNSKEDRIKTVSEVLEDLHYQAQKELGNSTKSVNRSVMLSQGLRKKKRMVP